MIGLLVGLSSVECTSIQLRSVPEEEEEEVDQATDVIAYVDAMMRMITPFNETLIFDCIRTK